jgi:hypothetical protein
MNKKNIPLILALAIPVVMILAVALAIYLPGIGQSPKYNFLYMSGSNIYYGYGQQEYTVSGGRLVQNPPQTAPNAYPPNYVQPDIAKPHFYVYDVSKDTATEITFEQAQTYHLDSSLTSPDGYSIAQGNGGGGDFIFGGGGGDYNSWFIKGHNRAHKLNLKLTAPNYYNFQFLGWIE